MEEGDEVWDGVEGWVNVDGWFNVVVGGRVETWETAREGVDGWGGGGWMEVWWWVGGKGWMERGGEGCRERDMYTRGYT